MKFKIGDKVKRVGLFNEELYFISTNKKYGTVIGFNYSYNEEEPWVQIDGEFYTSNGTEHINYYCPIFLEKVDFNEFDKSVKKFNFK